MNANHEPNIILGIQIAELTSSRRSQTNQGDRETNEYNMAAITVDAYIPQ